MRDNISDYRTSQVVNNIKLRDDVFQLVIRDEVISSIAKPGQFVMISSLNNFLPRPICISNVENDCFHLMIRIKGKGTLDLSRVQAGEKLNILGPLGNGFPIDIKNDNALVLAGGMGIAPVIFLVNYLMSKNIDTTLIYGENKGEELVLADMLKCVKKYASMDGAQGFKGNAVEALSAHLNDLKDNYTIYSCGPEIMYKSLAKLNIDKDIYISLEERMACGIGACMGCVVMTDSGYKRVCKDGPVFNIREIYNV